MRYSLMFTLICLVCCFSYASKASYNKIIVVGDIEAVPDQIILFEDDTITYNLIQNDINFEQVTDVQLVDSTEYGKISLNETSGEIIYIPYPDFFGHDSFEYKILDEEGNTSTTWVDITITGVNDAPTSADHTITINENETYHFKGSDILYSDVDGDCFNGFKVVTPLTEDLGDLYYSSLDIVLDLIYADPEQMDFITHPNMDGTTSFDFRVVDDHGAESENYTFTIHIIGNNEAPSSEDISITMAGNSTYGFSNELTYNDPDNDPFGGFEITSLPISGTLFYNSIPAVSSVNYLDFSALSYKPLDDQEGSPYTTFNLVVKDVHLESSPEITVTINVILEDRSLIISEGYSPNGDHINDYWHIENIEKYPENEVHIYNRWGSLIRSITDYNNGENAWRGESDHGLYGSTVTDGSYFYILSTGDGSPPIQGYVVLAR